MRVSERERRGGVELGGRWDSWRRMKRGEEGQKSREWEGEKDGDTERKRERGEGERQTDRQTKRQTDRQTDRH